MKKTEYFIAPGHQAHELETAINSCIKKRDLFLTENKSIIASVDKEDIKINYFGGNSNLVSVVIQITYYPKE